MTQVKMNIVLLTYIKAKSSRSLGFVLPITLIFIQSFYLLSLVAFTNIQLDKKINKQEIVQREIENIGRRLLLEYAHGLVIENIAGYQYEFTEQRLGIDSCAFIKARPSLVADYYRVSLIIKSLREEAIKIHMQSIITRATKPMSGCHESKHCVQQGLLKYYVL